MRKIRNYESDQQLLSIEGLGIAILLCSGIIAACEIPKLTRPVNQHLSSIIGERGRNRSKLTHFDPGTFGTLGHRTDNAAAQLIKWTVFFVLAVWLPVVNI